MTSYLSLKPEKKLLDPNFQSYRLSLDALPVLKQALELEPESFELNEQLYGYLHAHLTSLVNHLTCDPSSPEVVFYVEKGRKIKWSALSKLGSFSSQRTVWQIPSLTSATSGNATITFADSEWAFVCDGTSNIYLLNTPSRNEGEPWQVCHSHQMEQNSPLCLLLHSAHYVFPSSHQIELLVTYIAKASEISDIEKKLVSAGQTQFVCVLDWITFSCVLGQETERWQVKRKRKLLGLSVPLYAAVESSSSIILVSEKAFVFISDSEKPECISIKEEEKDSEINDEVDPPHYTFVQNQEDINVKIPVKEGTCKQDVAICITSRKLEVKVCNNPIVSGQTEGSLDADQCTWTIENSNLELHLTKTKTGWWKELVVGDKRGKEEMDPVLVEEVHQRLAHLTSETEADNVTTNQGVGVYDPQQLEDCDLSMDQMLLQRLDGETHKVTHLANIGGYQWLFKIATSADALPSFCTRYDVDGVVWQPVSQAGETEEFKVLHIATHPALGYVLASKVDRKFTTAAPDFSYAVVCDSVRHVYIYRQPELINQSLELRNRKTGHEVCHIAKQHVISLELCDQILGLKAAKECIFVLGKHCLYVIKIN